MCGCGWLKLIYFKLNHHNGYLNTFPRTRVLLLVKLQAICSTNNKTHLVAFWEPACGVHKVEWFALRPSCSRERLEIPSPSARVLHSIKPLLKECARLYLLQNPTTSAHQTRPIPTKPTKTYKQRDCNKHERVLGLIDL